MKTSKSLQISNITKNLLELDKRMATAITKFDTRFIESFYPYTLMEAVALLKEYQDFLEYKKKKLDK